MIAAVACPAAVALPHQCWPLTPAVDGDLKNEDVAISFGFDTAAKVYSELVGNIMVDAASAKKYYHFVRLMGRAASHLTLEVALQTHPQLALIRRDRRQALRGWPACIPGCSF